MDKIIEVLSQSTKGLTATTLSFFSGLFVRYNPELFDAINDVLQLIAFLVTICVGVFTLIGYAKKKNNKK